MASSEFTREDEYEDEDEDEDEEEEEDDDENQASDDTSLTGEEMMGFDFDRQLPSM